VREVASHFERKVVTERAGRGFDGFRRAHRLADGRHRLRAFPNHRHHGRGRDVRNQAVVKRFAFVDRIMRLGQFPADRHEFRRREAQSAPLEAGDDLPDQSALDAVGFDKYQGSFHRFLRK